jgi:hypothetical protein
LFSFLDFFAIIYSLYVLFACLKYKYIVPELQMSYNVEYDLFLS